MRVESAFGGRNGSPDFKLSNLLLILVRLLITSISRISCLQLADLLFFIQFSSTSHPTLISPRPTFPPCQVQVAAPERNSQLSRVWEFSALTSYFSSLSISRPTRRMESAQQVARLHDPWSMPKFQMSLRLPTERSTQAPRMVVQLA